MQQLLSTTSAHVLSVLAPSTREVVTWIVDTYLTTQSLVTKPDRQQHSQAGFYVLLQARAQLLSPRSRGSCRDLYSVSTVQVEACHSVHFTHAKAVGVHV